MTSRLRLAHHLCRPLRVPFRLREVGIGHGLARLPRVVIGWLLAGLLLAAVARSSAQGVTAGTNNLPVITTGRELLSLPVSETKRHYPLRLRGVVTFYDARFKTLFVQDETAGFWLFRTFTETNLAMGQLLEIAGVSDGEFGSHARPSSLRILGSAPLPPALPTTYEQLASGQVDCQLLEVQGVVHSMAYHQDFLRLDLAVGNDHIPISMPDFQDKQFPTNLIGARVSARGVCSMNLDREGKIIGFWLLVQNLGAITVLRPADLGVFSEPPRLVKSLITYGLNARYGDRVKVAGVVTLRRAGGEIFIRDASGALHVTPRQPWRHEDPGGRYLDPPPPPEVKPGDRVEVIGYPASGLPRAVLTDGEYYLAGPSTNAPLAKAIPAAAALNSDNDSELVSLEARVLQTALRLVGRRTNEVLSLQAGVTIFEAELEDAPALPVVRDSLVRVTGIIEQEAGPGARARSFRLLMRGPADLAVLDTPTLWTVGTIVRVSFVGGAVMLAALVWIQVLRQRVTTRTASLAATNERLVSEVAERQMADAELRRVESELRTALQKERELNELKGNFVNLVSHEFRTPLSIILSSSEILGAYLDTLSPAERAEHLRDIQDCCRYMAGMMEEVLVLGRVEAGKTHFRPTALDVSSFCRRLVEDVRSATNGQCPIEFGEDGVDEPARGDESLLRHIFQNLLTNAVKYSRANQKVTFFAHREGGEAVLTVRDRGIGIPTEDLKRIFTAFHRGLNVGQLPGSGLGLVIVKRCVDLHGGQIHIDSIEGQGTTVVVRLPLFIKTGFTTTLHRATLEKLPALE